MTLEENAIAGGAGAAVSEYLAATGITRSVLHLGLPDQFMDHNNHDTQIKLAGLDEAGITKAIVDRLNQLNLTEN